MPTEFQGTVKTESQVSEKTSSQQFHEPHPLPHILTGV
jgi:hypothetical protein